jgi:hypothetical protein
VLELREGGEKHKLSICTHPLVVYGEKLKSKKLKEENKYIKYLHQELKLSKNNDSSILNREY